MQNLSKKRNKFFTWKKFATLISIILFIVLMVFLNYHFKVRNINVEFFDQAAENSDIKNYTKSLVQQNANSFYSFLFLDENLLKKLIRDEYPIVEGVRISKKLNMDLNVVLSKNDDYFSTCMPEDKNFLINCMMGNSDGSYFKEIAASDANTINLELNPKVLYDANTQKPADNPDSLSGTRIYTAEDFKVIKELANWLVKNGFIIKKIYVDELKIVSFYTDKYILKVSLNLGFVNTVKSFELISRQGNLQKYINEDQTAINYIDLSYKDKVFYKLKNDIPSGIMSTSTASTTTATSSIQ